MATPPISVFVLVQTRSLLLDLAGPAEALRLANQALLRRGEPSAFQLRFIAAQASCVSSVGLHLAGLEPLPHELPPGSWLVLLGSRHPQADDAPPSSAERSDELRTLRWLNHQGKALLAPGSTGRLVSICSGALLAGAAGLLEERRCTTHHELLEQLRRRVPRAEVLDNRVFVLDGPLASSAGVTAGIDLTLHLIQLHCGDAIAAAVAQTMVVYLRRGPHDPELSPLLAHREHLHPALHRVQDALCAEPALSWSLARMAEVAHVTPRHLGRLFAEHAGTTPLRYLQTVRLELAERALSRGASRTEAATGAGFSSDQQWRRTRRTASR